MVSMKGQNMKKGLIAALSFIAGALAGGTGVYYYLNKKYDEKMDVNNDDVITYKEYIKYCEERALQKDNDEKQAKIDADTKKALDKYTEYNSKSTDGMVETEA